MNTRCPQCDCKLPWYERMRLGQWLGRPTTACERCGVQLAWNPRAFHWMKRGEWLQLIAMGIYYLLFILLALDPESGRWIINAMWVSVVLLGISGIMIFWASARLKLIALDGGFSPCPKCDYDLRASTGATCPECGTGFRRVNVDKTKDKSRWPVSSPALTHESCCTPLRLFLYHPLPQDRT
jgi:ssDNA-binding Zn-finger/Zn-ribbon topoisomerase 1